MKGKKIIKKIPKRVVAYLVVFALCIAYLGIMPVGEKKAKAVTSANSEWEYIENGGGTISTIRYYGMVNDLAIPEMIDDKILIRIGEGTFNCNTNLNSVIVPSSVTDVGQYAFYDCSNLEEVMLPNGLVNVGQFAFGECWNLRNIILPNSVMGIGDSAFSDCISLSKIRIPDNINSISNGTFFGCINLCEIILPDSLSRIENDAFSSCSSLTDVVLPNSLIYIGDRAFGGCSNLSRIEISKDVTFIGDNAFGSCPNLVIYTTSGSYAETYANEHGITVQLTDVPEPTPTPITPEPIIPDNPSGSDNEITCSPWPTDTESPTPSPTPTVSPTPSPTSTVSPTPSPTPTVSPTPSPTPTVSSTPSPTPTESPISRPTPTVPPTLSPTPIVSPTSSPTPKPAITVSPIISIPTSTPTPTSTPGTINTGKKTQKIHAKSVTKEYGSKPFDLGAYSDSYRDILYGSSDKKVVTIDKDGWATVKGYGKSTITITAPETDEYKKSTKKITVTIVPKKVTAKTLKSTTAKKVFYSWKKNKTVNGYQIYGSLKKDFSSNTFSRTVRSATSLSLSGLKSRKTYYFKVRAYKLVGKKKYYGKWSTVKKVKIK